MKVLMILAVSALCASGVAGQDAWSGKWQGSLINLPQRADAKPVDVVMELGGIPVKDNTCAQWRTTYSEAGEVKAVKDYKLCRGAGADDLYVDEGDGVKLTARLFNDTLVSPFKYDNRLLVSYIRLRGDELEEDILTVDDKPAGKGVVTMSPRGIQRLRLRRVGAMGAK